MDARSPRPRDKEPLLMLQMSKLIRSRDEWRAKATKRAEQVREFKKANLRYQNRISELKEKLIELEESNKKKLKIFLPSIIITPQFLYHKLKRLVLYVYS